MHSINGLNPIVLLSLFEGFLSQHYANRALEIILTIGEYRDQIVIVIALAYVLRKLKIAQFSFICSLCLVVFVTAALLRLWRKLDLYTA